MEIAACSDQEGRSIVESWRLLRACLLIKQPPPKNHNMQSGKLNQLTLVSALPLNQVFWHQNQTLWEMDMKKFPLGILFE